MHSSDFYESLLRGRVEAEFFCCRWRAGGGLQAEGSRQGLAHPWLDHRTSIIILPGKGNLSIRHQQEEDEKASNFEGKQQDAGLHRAHHHVSSVCQARTLEKAAGAWPQAQSRDLLISGCKYIVCFYSWTIFKKKKETHMSFLNNTYKKNPVFFSVVLCVIAFGRVLLVSTFWGSFNKSAGWVIHCSLFFSLVHTELMHASLLFTCEFGSNTIM